MGQKEDRSSQDASGWKEQDHQTFDVAYSLEESKFLPVDYVVDYVVDSEFVVVVAAALVVDDVAVAVAAVVATEVNADVVAEMAVAQM